MNARRIGLCLVIGVLATSEAPGAVELYAGQLTEADAAERLVGGPDAIGGVGDWALGNGTLCAVVSDPSHEADLMPSGGALVDLGHCGRADDQFVVLHSLVNLSRDAFVPVDDVRAVVADGEARIEASGGTGGLELHTTFGLDLREPDRLRIVSRLSRSRDGARATALGDLMLHVDASLAPWAGALDQGRALGFAHPDVDVERWWTLVRSIRRSDLHVAVGDPTLEPTVAYALHVSRAVHRGADGFETELPVWGLQDATISAFAVLAEPLWWGGDGDWLGLRELVQIPFLDLGVGESLTIERSLRVGTRADVAAVQDALLPGAPLLEGRTEPGAAVEARRADGTPESFVRANGDGRFAMRLRPGTYTLAFSAPGSRARELGPVEVKGDSALGDVALPEPARVALPHGVMRLVFEPLGETPAPRFRDALDGLRFGARELPTSVRSADLVRSGRADDPPSVVVEPGRYRVHAVRGPEHGTSHTVVDARAGATAQVELEPPVRLYETRGWIGADLHVHAAPSDDSALPLRDQALAFHAAGAEVIVATDHDHVTDYGPVLRALGIADRVASVVGAEVTSNVLSEAAPRTIGHSNAFPLPYRPYRYRKGVPSHEGRRLRDLVAAVRRLPGRPLLQLNHPRADGEPRDNAFFTHLGSGAGFDPSVPLDAPANRSLVERDPATGLRDLDFDVVELLNGPSLERYRLVRADWFALLRQGEFRAATANSDSHRRSEPAAFPRNYVRVAADEARLFDEAEFVAAVRAGRSWGTTGPLLDVRLGDAGVGETWRGADAELDVRIDAAPWVPVSELRVYRSGELAHVAAARAGGRYRIPLEFTRDAFVTVEVEGPAEATYAVLLPGFTPFAFTNPIFVDADADGSWTAPGL